ncbi:MULTISPECIES: hypothetical protein [Haladaptatus]|uniref:Uncharacterized protein n=1 Tax=Haladaptatus paucihalophilus DX253 TaxID=797209 RepID=A0A1M7CG50_HALPU|nr:MULTISPECIES: hypothetical protein [Haladaptatus]GKZ16318.1 hypothetical protein HAL_41990 [Haladaptatus sp. T7]SHL66228.1 hypothetical protein SAMN05444342_4357 [Haladaptatus paucihalophilus DX253]
MSQTDSASLWTGPQEFEGSLKALLDAARRGGVTFDRSWAFRRDDDHPDLMVEVTRLVTDSDTAHSCDEYAPTMGETEFETELSSLLRSASRSGIGFDRAWTFRCADGIDLMVEITRLAKR